MPEQTPVSSIFRPQRDIFLTLLVLLISVAGWTGYLMLASAPPSASAPPEPTAPSPSPAPPAQETRLIEVAGAFARNESFADALADLGVSREEVHRLVETTRPVYDLARVGTGRPYWLVFAQPGELNELRYPVDDERYLTVYRRGDRYVPVMKKFLFDTRLEPVAGVIEDSLFMAVKETGEQEQLALDLADIFMWDIDFYTDIQKGDSFRMLVEKKYLDGRFAKYGEIVAADVTNEGKAYTGFRFQGEDGVWGYYAPDGRALKKSFLKSPLKFARISSSFSRRRFHPVLKVVRPHLGVDYAAPAGTPVVAVGLGTVEFAGFSGGSGKMVKLRHAGGYQTLYLHLSRLVVRRGERVAQGEVIGFVGSTGLATGPHLDFRVIERGKYIDPARVVFPPSPPVPHSAFTEFAALRDGLQSQLDQITF